MRVAIYKRSIRFAVIMVLYLVTMATLANAQTTVTAYVKLGCANNGDGTTTDCAASDGGVGAYNSIRLAINDREKDLVTDNEIMDIRCIPNGSNPDDFGTLVSTYANYTTSATNRVIVRSHDPDDRCEITSAAVDQPPIRTDGHGDIFDLDFVSTTTGTGRAFCVDLRTAPSGVTVNIAGNTCRYEPTGGTPTTGWCKGFNLTGGSEEDSMVVKAWNNYATGFTGCGDSKGFELTTSFHENGEIYAYNNTSVGNGTNFGIYNFGTGAVTKFRNNLACDATSNDYDSGTSTGLTTSNNMTCDATSPNSLGSATVTFASAGSYVVNSGSDSIDAGGDLSADADLSFSTDIDGTTRSGTWDIGAYELEVPSAPVVETTSTGVQNSALTSHPITMPSGIVEGDLILVFFSVDGSKVGVTPSAGTNWLAHGHASQGSVSGLVFWKIAEGGDALTLSLSSARATSYVAYRISNATGIAGVFTTGNSTNSDPPAYNSGLSAREVLWVASRHGDGLVAPSAAPSGYSSLLGDAATGVSTHTAHLATSLASEDPGVFTSAAEQWASWTVAVFSDTATDSVSGVGGTFASASTGVAWNNMPNVTALDGVPAEAPNVDGELTQIFNITNFGLVIPDGSVIESIDAEMYVTYQSGSGAGYVSWELIQLIKAGSPEGNNRATDFGSGDIGESSSTYTQWNIRNGSDLWGGTFTEADVEDSQFGIGIRMEEEDGDARDVRVDYVEVTVNYFVDAEPAEPSEPVGILQNFNQGFDAHFDTGFD